MSAGNADGVLRSWRPRPGDLFLRRYSDAVNSALLGDWLPSLQGRRVLKTDLFDEAVAGGLYPHLVARGADVVGLDVSAAVVSAARARYPELEAVEADVRSLPWPGESFDVVISNSTLDHLSSPAEIEDAVLELTRVLEPHGVLVLTLDNAANPLVALRNALPSRVLVRAGLIPYSTGATLGPTALRRLLVRSGFAVTAERAVMHAPRLALRAATSVASSDRVARTAARVEALGRTPLRYVTGQFVAARGVKLPPPA